MIIIYDDENSNELNILKKITHKSEKILILRNKSNLGAGISRNIGIENAKGKYLAFIDADDFPDKKIRKANSLHGEK